MNNYYNQRPYDIQNTTTAARKTNDIESIKNENKIISNFPNREEQ